MIQRWMHLPGLMVTILFLLHGCAPSPTEHTIRQTIGQHFMAQNLRVVLLEIGKIEKTPLRDLTYMGGEGFSVEIRSITLEALEDRPVPPAMRKGDQITYRNGMIRIKEPYGRKGEWIVGDVRFGRELRMNNRKSIQ